MLRTNRNFFAAALLADELARGGVRHIAVCPGSRSSPLAMTFAADPRFRCCSIIDERSAAFFALGAGKATGVAAAVVCTSGTAVANLLPAVVEASQAGVPLLLLTADRPPELRDTGANQAIDQVKIFGGYTRWFAEVGLPEATETYAAYLRSIVARAVHVAAGRPAGPVHLNLPFRDPLAPTGVPEDFAATDWDSEAVRGRDAAAPWVTVVPPPAVVADAEVDDLATLVQGHAKGIVLAGYIERPSAGLREAVANFAFNAGYPVLAEPLSGLRLGPHDRANVIAHYDAFLRGPGVAARLRPDVVVRIGASTTSKVTPTWIDATGALQVVVDPDGGWLDPGHRVARFVRGAVAETLDAVANRVAGTDTDWPATWVTADRAAAAALVEHRGTAAGVSEGAVAAAVVEALPDGAILFTAPSMPIRDLEAFVPSGPYEIVVMANRGANGIDGVLSTAIGVAAAQERPVTLLTGDVALLHDVGGLLTLARSGVALTIVVVNNDGGGIFSFLPQAAFPERFDEVFTTRHGLDFARIATAFGIAHERVMPGEVGAAVRRGERGARIVEVAMPGIAENVAAHREAWAAVAASVRAALGVA